MLVVPSVGAAPAPGPVPNGSAAAFVEGWGYGGSRWVNASGSTPDGQWMYSIHAFVGVQVLVQQVNTSSTTFELTVNRTLVANLFVLLCHPNCASPTASANLSRQAWEVASATDNFSTAGQVTGPSGPVPAVTLLNASTSAQANFTERGVANVTGPLGTHHSTAFLSVQSAAAMAVSFTPGLGLFPDNLSATPSWTSSSNYSGHGIWSVDYAYARSPFGQIPTSGTGSANGTVAHSGNVSLAGSVLGSVTLHGGLAVTAVRFALTGPFAFREGLILVPAGADLFGSTSSSGAWTQDAQAAESASTDATDFAGASHQRPVIAASATAFAASPAEPSATAAMAGPSGLSAFVTPASAGSAATTLQAQPEMESYAQSQSLCLLAGNCPKSTSGPTELGHLGGVLFLAVAVVGLTVVVVGLVVARQPPRKDPPSPNASLYPTGAVAPPPPVRPATPGTPPPPDDPLGHLW